MNIQVWAEGYMATCEHGEAILLGTFEAENFDDAVKQWLATIPEEQVPKYYEHKERMVLDPEAPLGRSLKWIHTYWACRLYDNEADAKKSFG